MARVLDDLQWRPGRTCVIVKSNSGLWLVFRRRTDAYTTGSQISETVCKPPAFGVRRKPKVPVDDTHLFSGGFPWPDQQTPSPS